MTTPDEGEPSSLTAGLLQLVENMAQFYEAAEGQKTLLIDRGWSASVAERAAGELLCGMIRLTFSR